MRDMCAVLLGRTHGNTCERVEGSGRQKKALNFHVATASTSNDPTMDSGLGWPLRVVLPGGT